MPDLARFNDLPRLYRRRAQLRAKFERFHRELNKVPRNQVLINQIRAALPRPVGDYDFWELLTWERD